MSQYELSRRQKQIQALILEAKTFKVIAGELKCSRYTIRSHWEIIRAFHQVTSVPELLVKLLSRAA